MGRFFFFVAFFFTGLRNTGRRFTGLRFTGIQFTGFRFRGFRPSISPLIRMLVRVARRSASSVFALLHQ
jgi:hypothetical protein